MALFNTRLPRAGNLYLKVAYTQPQRGDAITEVTLQVRLWLNALAREEQAWE
jgi:hypothetical protein